MSRTYVATCSPIIAAIVCLSSVSGHAQDRDVRTARVAVADLDLSSAAGQRTLARRVSTAISNVCDSGGFADLKMVQHQRECRVKARQDAEPQILAAAEAARGRRSTVLASAGPVPTR
ncbi:UrcA family protein [Sphingomonas sp. CARO-RG-8B-R24-01]|uniref:UrcA family protein n=1 Tax=Sphingomonas sp. CARO-RG-8B-R24-01 TaxID=2914831 RepID=UPI001F588837|nr:UrcA family protein [Sphingomonas sp. CARO-RG-8B-R24-01]